MNRCCFKHTVIHVERRKGNLLYHYWLCSSDLQLDPDRIFYLAMLCQSIRPTIFAPSYHLFRFGRVPSGRLFPAGRSLEGGAVGGAGLATGVGVRRGLTGGGRWIRVGSEPSGKAESRVGGSTGLQRSGYYRCTVIHCRMLTHRGRIRLLLFGLRYRVPSYSHLPADCCFCSSGFSRTAVFARYALESNVEVCVLSKGRQSGKGGHKRGY